MTIKPYLYGGVALLIVGLFCASLIYQTKLEASELRTRELIFNLEAASSRVLEIEKREARKEASAEAYFKATEALNASLASANRIIGTYTKRDTPDEKCLDMSPPDELIRLLRENSLPGQGSMHRSVGVPTGTSKPSP